MAPGLTRDEKQHLLALLIERSRRQCEASFLAFIREAWPIVEPAAEFVPNWHIDRLARLLEAVTVGDVQNALINEPPGCMKSLMVSVLWPAWEWTTRPDLRYLCVSFDQQLSTRDAKKVRDLVTSSWYQARWPGVQLADDQNQKTRYNTTAGGWRIATTPRGRGLGEHPHRKIIDDPHNHKEAHSDAERQIAIDFYDQTLSTRGAALGAATLIIMQRLHENDLSGHVLTGGEAFEHVCWPMRYEPGRMAKGRPWSDPRTRPGDLLWPAMWSEEKLAPTERKLGGYGTAGQMQQRPAPAEGGLIKRRWWRYYPPLPLPRLDEVVLSLDPATKDKAKSDFWALQAWGRRGADVYFLRSARGRWDLVEGLQQVRDMHRWAAVTLPGVRITVLVENAAAGPEVVAELKRHVPGVLAVTPKGDKKQRVYAVTPTIEAGNAWLPGAALPDGECDPARTPAWVQEFLAECASFPNAVHDDQVDAMSQALLRLGAPQATVATVKAGRRHTRETADRPTAASPYTAAELRELERLVAQHGSEAVRATKQLTNPYFALPAHLEGIPPGGGRAWQTPR